MNEEAKEIALRFKGEDYTDCIPQLKEEGFQFQGFDEWISPHTGCAYRFVVAEGSGYVVRVEQVSGGSPEIIHTEFIDHEAALYRYATENARPSVVTLATAVCNLKNTLLTISVSKAIRMIEAEKEAGNPDAEFLCRQLRTNDRGKIDFKNYLFCNGEICFYSSVRRPTHELLYTMERSGKKLYFYRARPYVEDLLDSLAGKIKLRNLLGEEALSRPPFVKE